MFDYNLISELTANERPHQQCVVALFI